MPNQDNTALASQHYENFPVASFALPKDLRYPIALIYHFARCADDFADEDNHTQAERLVLLQGYVDELNIIKANGSSQDAFFIEFAQMLRDRKLPLAPFYDLLDAFKQDVIKTRYVNFDEVLDIANVQPTRLALYYYTYSTKPHLRTWRTRIISVAHYS